MKNNISQNVTISQYAALFLKVLKILYFNHANDTIFSRYHLQRAGNESLLLEHTGGQYENIYTKTR